MERHLEGNFSFFKDNQIKSLALLFAAEREDCFLKGLPCWCSEDIVGHQINKFTKLKTQDNVKQQQQQNLPMNIASL